MAVVKDANGKPIENAAVVFHLTGEEGKGNMEMKTNEEGKAIIDVIPIGDTMRLQVIADGFQTFGQDYKIDTDTKGHYRAPQAAATAVLDLRPCRFGKHFRQPVECAATKYDANSPKAVIFPDRSPRDDRIAPNRIGVSGSIHRAFT